MCIGGEGQPTPRREQREAEERSRLDDVPTDRGQNGCGVLRPAGTGGRGERIEVDGVDVGRGRGGDNGRPDELDDRRREEPECALDLRCRDVSHGAGPTAGVEHDGVVDAGRCGSFEADGMEGKGRSESVDPVVHQVDVGRHRSIVPKT
ncbi:MAG: hypothetical protein V9G12_19740 [Microthrixaceae bacterium]